MHLDPCFLGHLVFFITVGATWALSGNILLCFSWDHLDPNLILVSLRVVFFWYIFLLWLVLSFYFLYFLLHMLKQLPVGRLVFYFVRSFGSLPLILELITRLLIIVHHIISLRRGACIALGRFLFSQLLLSQFPCICIIY